MVVKQIYSLIEYDEAVKNHGGWCRHIGLVPMQNGGVPAHRVPIERVHAFSTNASVVASPPWPSC